MADVAAKVGVSPITVSMALRDHHRISVERRQQIKRVAREMGFVPDPLLSALSAHRRQRMSAKDHGVPPVSLAPAPVGLGSVAGQLQLSWPADHTGWSLQMQTNLADTNRVTVPGADMTNVILISPTNTSLFFRLVYP